MHSPHPRHKCYHKNRESRTDLLHQHIASTHLRLPLLPSSAKDVKELLQMFRPWQDSNQDRAARLTSTRQVNSDRIDAQLPSLVCDPTIAMDPERTPATVSLSDLQEEQNCFFSNHIV